MQGIFAFAQNSYRLATVEKGITDRAIADALAFVFAQTWDARRGARRTGRQNDKIRSVLGRRLRSGSTGPQNPMPVISS